MYQYLLVVVALFAVSGCSRTKEQENNQVSEQARQRILLNQDWQFYKYENTEQADQLIYDVRPEFESFNDAKDADTRPTDAVAVVSQSSVLKPWILPTGNQFIADKNKWHKRPEGNPGSEFAFVQADFNDSQWQSVNLPHDWAIAGPFYQGENPTVGGGMGRLPSPGVAWYRKKLNFSQNDIGKKIYLDIEGAMSYSMVWLNGHLVGGWPFGYASYQLDLTDYINFAGDNQLAIRLDNPNHSSRWYPGGGLYRNVWLTKTQPLHIEQWGTKVDTLSVTDNSAQIQLQLSVKNNSDKNQTLGISTQIFELNQQANITGKAVVSLEPQFVNAAAVSSSSLVKLIDIPSPKLWGPKPQQTPHMYTLVNKVWLNGQVIDEYSTPFGIRTLEFDANAGVLVNGELIKLKGVNQHHDLGALGAAFNRRAAERQLELLQEMGVNAIRMAHNPPAPELLDLTDQMGFLVVDESFDVWQKKKTPHDFHLIFDDWHEQDMRALVRRDYNHPSVIMWSIGNEVGEQYEGLAGYQLAQKLTDIVKSEDPHRPTTASKNWAKPDMPFANGMDVINLNYQGEGIRQDPIFAEVKNRIKTKPQYIPYHQAHPDKVIIGSETASALSSRGFYTFPVTDKISSPVRDGMGGDSKVHQVSSYELYAVDFGSSADKVFKSVESHPFVAGEFVWTGWDYLGEPTPYYSSRSSYNGIIDLAGFKKDRFYLYQAHWRPDFAMVHILPHWNWPERIGKVTPVHIFTSGDEVELFLNGQSLGRKQKQAYQYRLRFDDVVYQPGSLTAVAYKNGKTWATTSVSTTESANKIQLTADRSSIKNDGKDLTFITARVQDKNGLTVPTANNWLEFSVEGNGEIVATDNGDSTDFTPFPSPERNAFNGLALVIVKAKQGTDGGFKLIAKSKGLVGASIQIETK
ncbi:beta-galactosidase GalB (plasmid) [Catenovulum sp. SX2]|uniref:beta-galactosidase GalB n=1 Tax=Catenovulum sp. SX2 TaxID=3398614 RepID=UPI003F8336A0